MQEYPPVVLLMLLGAQSIRGTVLSAPHTALGWRNVLPLELYLLLWFLPLSFPSPFCKHTGQGPTPSIVKKQRPGAAIKWK